jgi:hypothetical protein
LQGHWVLFSTISTCICFSDLRKDHLGLFLIFVLVGVVLLSESCCTRASLRYDCLI